jgi:glycosyltransferase involved in cell wall biosynthesis
MSGKNLLIFNQHASYLTVDIANAFAGSGKYQSIVLIAGVINIRDTKLDRRVRTIKTMPYIKTNIFTRFISWSIAFFHLIFILTFRFRTYKLFLVSNPPLISFLHRFCSNVYSVLIFDIYPDALASGGFVSEKSIIYRYWQKANRHFFSKAEDVFTISDGMKTCLAQYCDPAKIKIVSLWSSFTPLVIPKEENVFIHEFKLQGKFIVMYSGNMGKGSGLEVLIEVARLLHEEKDIIFMFIGEGWIMPVLQKKVKDFTLNNCIFLPYQGASILKHSLSAANLSVVTLPMATSSVSIPNKTYTLLALGRPLLCLSATDSDLSKLVKTYDIGEVFDGSSPEKISDYILRAKNNVSYRNKLNKNAIECSVFFTKANASLFIN